LGRREDFKTDNSSVGKGGKDLLGKKRKEVPESWASEKKEEYSGGLVTPSKKEKKKRRKCGESQARKMEK